MKIKAFKLFFFCSLSIPVAYARVPCHNALCKWQPNGASFRVSDDHPGFFVQCSNGDAYCFDCPANLIFDNHLQVCVFPNKMSKPVSHLECSKDLCKWKPEGTLFQYPWRPTFYVQCTHGTSVCRPCPKGLIFLNSKQVCDFPRNW